MLDYRRLFVVICFLSFTWASIVPILKEERPQIKEALTISSSAENVEESIVIQSNSEDSAPAVVNIELVSRNLENDVDDSSDKLRISEKSTKGKNKPGKPGTSSTSSSKPEKPNSSGKPEKPTSSGNSAKPSNSASVISSAKPGKPDNQASSTSSKPGKPEKPNNSNQSTLASTTSSNATPAKPNKPTHNKPTTSTQSGSKPNKPPQVQTPTNTAATDDKPTETELYSVTLTASEKDLAPPATHENSQRNPSVDNSATAQLTPVSESPSEFQSSNKVNATDEKNVDIATVINVAAEIVGPQFNYSTPGGSVIGKPFVIDFGFVKPKEDIANDKPAKTEVLTVTITSSDHDLPSDHEHSQEQVIVTDNSPSNPSISNSAGVQQAPIPEIPSEIPSSNKVNATDDKNVNIATVINVAAEVTGPQFNISTSEVFGKPSFFDFSFLKPKENAKDKIEQNNSNTETAASTASKLEAQIERIKYEVIKALNNSASFFGIDKTTGGSVNPGYNSEAISKLGPLTDEQVKVILSAFANHTEIIRLSLQQNLNSAQAQKTSYKVAQNENAVIGDEDKTNQVSATEQLGSQESSITVPVENLAKPEIYYEVEEMTDEDADPSVSIQHPVYGNSGNIQFGNFQAQLQQILMNTILQLQQQQRPPLPSGSQEQIQYTITSSNGNFDSNTPSHQLGSVITQIVQTLLQPQSIQSYPVFVNHASGNGAIPISTSSIVGQPTLSHVGAIPQGTTVSHLAVSPQSSGATSGNYLHPVNSNIAFAAVYPAVLPPVHTNPNLVVLANQPNIPDTENMPIEPSVAETNPSPSALTTTTEEDMFVEEVQPVSVDTMGDEKKNNVAIEKLYRPNYNNAPPADVNPPMQMGDKAPPNLSRPPYSQSPQTVTLHNYPRPPLSGPQFTSQSSNGDTVQQNHVVSGANSFSERPSRPSLPLSHLGQQNFQNLGQNAVADKPDKPSMPENSQSQQNSQNMGQNPLGDKPDKPSKPENSQSQQNHQHMGQNPLGDKPDKPSKPENSQSQQNPQLLGQNALADKPDKPSKPENSQSQQTPQNFGQQNTVADKPDKPSKPENSQFQQNSQNLGQNPGKPDKPFKPENSQVQQNFQNLEQNSVAGKPGHHASKPSTNENSQVLQNNAQINLSPVSLLTESQLTTGTGKPNSPQVDTPAQDNMQTVVFITTRPRPNSQSRPGKPNRPQEAAVTLTESKPFAVGTAHDKPDKDKHPTSNSVKNEDETKELTASQNKTDVKDGQKEYASSQKMNSVKEVVGGQSDHENRLVVNVTFNTDKDKPVEISAEKSPSDPKPATDAKPSSGKKPSGHKKPKPKPNGKPGTATATDAVKPKPHFGFGFGKRKPSHKQGVTTEDVNEVAAKPPVSKPTGWQLPKWPSFASLYQNLFGARQRNDDFEGYEGDACVPPTVNLRDKQDDRPLCGSDLPKDGFTCEKLCKDSGFNVGTCLEDNSCICSYSESTEVGLKMEYYYDRNVTDWEDYYPSYESCSRCSCSNLCTETGYFLGICGNTCYCARPFHNGVPLELFTSPEQKSQ